MGSPSCNEQTTHTQNTSTLLSGSSSLPEPNAHSGHQLPLPLTLSLLRGQGQLMQALPPPGLLLCPPPLGSACSFFYTPWYWEYTSAYALTAMLLTFWRECTECQTWGGPAPSWAALPWQS